MIERGGKFVLHLCDNVEQRTIQPLMTAAITPSTLVNTDEYSSYNRLTEWGRGHVTVNQGDGEYARDDDRDGTNEVHVNTIEGVRPLMAAPIPGNLAPMVTALSWTLPGHAQAAPTRSVSSWPTPVFIARLSSPESTMSLSHKVCQAARARDTSLPTLKLIEYAKDLHQG